MNQKIIENSVDGDTNLFDEIKKKRKSGPPEEVVIEGAFGKQMFMKSYVTGNLMVIL